MANNVIDRNSLSGLIPEPVTREIIQGAVAESAVLRMARRLPNMTSKTQTMNVLDMLPTAYWVNGEVSGTGAADSAAYKQTTALHGGGQGEPHHQRRLYGRQAPLGRDRGSAQRASARP